MVRWSVLLLMIVAALVVHAAAQGIPVRQALGDPLARSETAVVAVAPAASRGWLWATPLTALAAMLQLVCVMKARERHAQILAGGADEAALPYLRFYAEAPVFVGFLGSVTGAILLQLLAVGQMIYFAYLSTATGLLAFLWIQYRYVIAAEVASAREEPPA